MATKSTENSGKSTGKAKGNPGNLRPWKKGQSGNPGGRPKIEGAEEIKEALKLHAPAAVDVVVSIMNDPEASSTNRLAAANAILDRTLGKPTQAIDNNINMGSDFDAWVKRRLKGE